MHCPTHCMMRCLGRVHAFILHGLGTHRHWIPSGSFGGGFRHRGAAQHERRNDQNGFQGRFHGLVLSLCDAASISRCGTTDATSSTIVLLHSAQVTLTFGHPAAISWWLVHPFLSSKVPETGDGRCQLVARHASAGDETSFMFPSWFKQPASVIAAYEFRSKQ